MTVGQDRLQRCKDRGAQRGQVSDSGRVPRRLKPEHDRKAHDRPRLGSCSRFRSCGRFFFFVGVAVHAIPPLTLVVLRVGIPRSRWRSSSGRWRIPAPLAASPRRVRRHGFFDDAVPFTLIVFGQTQIPSGLAAILNATTPLFTVLVAHVFTRDERITPAKLAGVGVGFLGVVAMIAPSLAGAAGAPMGAQLACLAAALSYAFAGVYGRRFKALGVKPLAAATGQVAASTLMLLPLALAVDRPWTLPQPASAHSPRCSASRCSRRRWPMRSISACSPAPARQISCSSPSSSR